MRLKEIAAHSRARIRAEKIALVKEFWAYSFPFTSVAVRANNMAVFRKLSLSSRQLEKLIGRGPFAGGAGD